MEKYTIGILLTLLTAAQPTFATELSSPDSNQETTSGSPPKPDRKFSLSSGYLDQEFHSNDGISQFPLSMLDGYGYLFDKITGSWASTPGKRALSFLISFPAADWIGSALTLGFHEFGHARAVTALGGTYYYSVPFYNQTNISNFWELSFWLLHTPPPDISGEVPFTNYTGGLQLPSGTTSYYGQNGADIMVAAAGINNSTFLSNRMAQSIYWSGGHVANWQTYYWAKLDGMFYALFVDPTRAGNDINAVVTDYQAKGYSITSGTIAKQYALGLLSGTSLSFFKGIYDYIAHGDSVVHTLEWKGIRFPEFSSYMNARGLSFEVSTGYRVSDSIVTDLSYEWITVGDFTQQLTPRLTFELASLVPSLNSLWLTLEAFIGTGTGGSVEANWRPSKRSEGLLESLSYDLKWTTFNRYTLYGERNSPNIQNGDNTSQLIASVQFHY